MFHHVGRWWVGGWVGLDGALVCDVGAARGSKVVAVYQGTPAPLLVDFELALWE